MKLFFDSSVIVDVDKGREETVELMKELTREKYPLFISTVTVSEILTGAYRKDSTKEARKILGQFQWVEMNGGIADRSGEIMAELYERGKPIEFQDIVIAASAEQENVEKLVTKNSEHFGYIDSLETEVITPEQLREEIEQD